MKNGPECGPCPVEAQFVNDTELLTADQLADRLRVRPRTVQAWARHGRIPTVRLSAKVVRFRWSAVLAALCGGTRRREASRA
jgi:excisionase family DNA binding protein